MNNKLIAALILFSGFFLSSDEEKEKYKPDLPNFKDILEVKHSIPGRIRLQCKVLKDDLQGKQALLNTFSKIPGITEITINPCIGTILIKYQEEVIQPMLIIGIVLKVLGLEDEAHNENRSLITKESAEVLNSLSHTIYEKTSGILDLKSSVMLLLGTYAIYDIKTRPGVRPAGITCLWWLYGLINRSN